MRPVQPSAEWEALPPVLRTAIETRAGTVTGTSPAGEGLSTSVRLILHAASGDIFVKGTGPESPDYQRTRLARGADLAPYLTAVSPPLLWRLHAAGWDVTGWPALPGRPWADQKPGSADIPKVTRLLAELSLIPAPGVLTTTAREYWQQYTTQPGPVPHPASALLRTVLSSNSDKCSHVGTEASACQHFRAACWPTEQVAEHLRPAIVLRTRRLDGRMVRNHAKFLAIDHRFLLVTSANFSWSAENGNVEFGVLIDNRSLAEAAEDGMRRAEDRLFEPARGDRHLG